MPHESFQPNNSAQPWNEGTIVTAAWQRPLTYLLYATVGWVAYLALNIAIASKGIVPGFDALAYLSSAFRVNLEFTSGGLASLFNLRVDGQPWPGLPFTNTLDVLLLAMLYNLVDYHVGVWLIHTVYVVVFLVLLRRTLHITTTAVIVLWAISHTFFIHQYTQFISEMKVGMFLILFTVYLFNDTTKKRSSILFWITAVLLLLRVVNILFVLPLAAAYAAIQWRRGARWREIAVGLKPIGLALLILSPLLLFEIQSVFAYLYKASYSDTAQNWKDMAGVDGKWSLFQSYGRNLLLYQHELVVGALAVIAAGVVLHATPAKARLGSFRNYLVASLVVFGVLMQAQSNNVMLVYWPFMFIGLSAIAVLVALLKPALVGLVAVLLVPVAVSINYLSFTSSYRSIAQKIPIMELANGLAHSMAAIDKPVVFQNYFGVGQLDFQGLEIVSNRRVAWPKIDNISYNTELSAYMASMDAANVVFIANRNFMWPNYLGVNHKTAAIAQEVGLRAREMGLTKTTRLYSTTGETDFIDVYLRPTFAIKLKYLQFNDRWLDQETSLALKYGDRALALDGYVMELDVEVPGVDDPAFGLPLTVKLIDMEGKVVNTAVLNRTGPNKLSYPLDGVLPGNYRIVFDKTFVPKNDRRKLSALYVGAALTHVKRSPATGAATK